MHRVVDEEPGEEFDAVWRCTMPDEAPVVTFEAHGVVKTVQSNMLHTGALGVEIVERISTVALRMARARRSASTASLETDAVPAPP